MNFFSFLRETEKETGRKKEDRIKGQRREIMDWKVFLAGIYCECNSLGVGVGERAGVESKRNVVASRQGSVSCMEF